MIQLLNRMLDILNSLGLTALLVVASLLGLAIRQFLFLIGQKWVATMHITLAYMFLPAITLVVTELIAGDIALSLGMVGALSIVRFRNPVKSPLELVMYFLLITLGIGLSTRPAYSLILSGFIIAILAIVNQLQNFFKFRGKTLFASSFEENSALQVIEFTSKKAIPELEMNNNLIEIQYIESEKIYVYRLAFSYRHEALEVLEKNRDSKGISSFNIRLS